MDELEQIRLLTDYSRWADERLLEAASRLTESDLDRQVHPTLPAARSIFLHMLGTPLFWLGLWEGKRIARTEPHDLVAIREAYTACHERLGAFVQNLARKDLDRREKWWAKWGYDQELELGKTLLQVINHATQHRSEIAVILTALGRSPGDLDLLTYLGAP